MIDILVRREIQAKDIPRGRVNVVKKNRFVASRVNEARGDAANAGKDFANPHLNVHRFFLNDLSYISCIYYTSLVYPGKRTVRHVSSNRRRGRPRGRNLARTTAARTFFTTIDRLGFTYDDVIAVIESKFREAPSYRTLQDWRRGVNRPRFMPFELWTEALRTFAARRPRKAA
jgi:hypothetical protein